MWCFILGVCSDVGSNRVERERVMGSVNYTVLSGYVTGTPIDCETASGFPTTKIYVSLLSKRKTKGGRVIGESFVVPVYFYGDVARYVLLRVFAGDMVVIEAQLKRDTRGPLDDDPWLQLGGRSIKVIPARGEPHEFVDRVITGAADENEVKGGEQGE